MSRNAVRGCAAPHCTGTSTSWCSRIRVRELETTLVFVNRNEMAAEIVFTRKGSPATSVVAHMWLESVRIVCCHVCFQVERACKSSRTTRTLVLFAWVRCRLGWHRYKATHEAGTGSKFAFGTLLLPFAGIVGTGRRAQLVIRCSRGD